MTIEEIIKTMEEDFPEGNRTRLDMELRVDGKLYKLIAYKIRNQNLIRIDIKKLNG